MNKKVLTKKLWKLEVADYIVLLMIVTYAVFFSYYTIMRHYSFRSGTWDLGILVQSIASASKGQLFTNNVELYYSSTGSYFGIHFTPILFAVIPFFHLVPKVETILILQSTVLALGALPTYLMAKRYRDSSLAALFLSAAYLLSPLLQGINWYDFHTQAFFPLLILSATYFLKIRRTLPFLFCTVLTLMTMEQASYLVALYGVYVFWELKTDVKELLFSKKITIHSLLPFVVFLSVILWIALSSNIIHSLNPNPSPELKAVGAYKILEISDPSEIPVKAITNLDLALKAIRINLPSKIFYVVLTFVPSGFLALLNPIAILPVLLWLFLAILSNHAPYYQLGFQYTAFTLPFLTIATMEGMKKLTKVVNEESKTRIWVRISVILLIIGLILSILCSPLSFIHKSGNFEYFRDYGASTPSDIDNEIMKICEMMPNGALVITTQTIFPHIATNINAYVIPPEKAPSPALYDTHLKYLKSLNYDYIFYTYFWDTNEANLLYNNFIKNQSVYKLFVKGAGIELYKKEYDGQPTRRTIRIAYKELATLDSVIVDDPSSESGKVIMLKPSPIEGKFVWYGPYITLTPGNYTAHFRLKVDSVPEGKILKLNVFSSTLRKNTEITSYDLSDEDFGKSLVWHTFSISFSITERTTNVEFRGIEAASDVGIWLDYVEIMFE
jgi:uncharacterized membrane protein